LLYLFRRDFPFVLLRGAVIPHEGLSSLTQVSKDQISFHKLLSEVYLAGEQSKSKSIKDANDAQLPNFFEPERQLLLFELKGKPADERESLLKQYPQLKGSIEKLEAGQNVFLRYPYQFYNKNNSNRLTEPNRTINNMARDGYEDVVELLRQHDRKDATNSSCNDWNFALDYLRSPNDQLQQVLPDACGHSTWYLMDSGTLSYDPSLYVPLTIYSNNEPHCSPGSGVKTWKGSTGFPDINVIASGTDQICDGGAIKENFSRAHVHPSPSSAAVVGWKSPVSGKVIVEMNLSDMNTSCGDGVDWYIQKNGTMQATRSFGNGGTASLLKNVSVSKGDFLYFGIGPGPNGDHTCDTTSIDITITHLISD
jgi:hypothetical protein